MNIKTGLSIAAVSISALMGITILAGSWYTVPEGSRAVITTNGAATGVAEPGLHFKWPLIQSAVDINVQNRTTVYENVLAYSRDQQTASMSITVNYRLPPDQVLSIYSEWGGEAGIVSRLLDRQVLEESKTVFGRYNAATSIQERARLNIEVQQAIQDAVQGPIIVESVQLENIDFSDAYEQSIEQRMLAEVEVQRVQQNAERERVQAEITVIQAQAQADSTLAQANAEAEAIRIRGEAEAAAIDARGRALRDNPLLINLVQAERWNGQLPTTVLPDTVIPLLNN